MIADKACWERGCACHDMWDTGVEVVEKREWVGLTDEDMGCLFPHGASVWVQETVKIIEAKLKEKNA